MTRATSSRATRRTRSTARSKAVKDALAGSDVEKIKDATEGLVNASHEFTQRLYEQASQSAGPGPGASDGDGSTQSDDEVVDAEIVDEPGA